MKGPYQKPSLWQRKAVAGIVRRMTGPTAARAALLQLPTGFGKSLVAVQTYAKLRAIRPDLRLLVVLPKQQIPVGWQTALGYRKEADLGMFEWSSPPAVGGLVRFETKLELKRAMLCDSGGRPPWLATQIHERPHLIVVDEVHRHRAVLETLSGIFLESDGDDRTQAERALTKPFRSPARGRRSWPKWLLLSATPFNPVSLDSIDPLDKRTSGETFEADGQDEEALACEIEKTLGALAFLAGMPRENWFNCHVDEVRNRLNDGHVGRPIHPPRQLLVWPAVAKQRAFSPPAKRRWQSPTPTLNKAAERASIVELVRTTRSFEGGSARLIRRRATTERFVLSGGNLKVVGHRIEGETYSSSLARCVARAVAVRRKSDKSRPTKLERLFYLICGPAKGQNILIFCVHRAIARAVANEIQLGCNEQYLNTSVRTAIGSISDGDRRWFNRHSEGKTRVLVATDACSESIDLHERADVLVHYELPWSPLRVLQRVGRLWRIRRREVRPGSFPKTPRLPGIVHFAHPGSVDEEILSRLRRRWGHLRVLGLDYLSYEQAMGMRLPAVSWQSHDSWMSPRREGADQASLGN